MNDKEILAEVYRRLIDERQKYRTALPSPLISFIETEWQKEDEIEAKLNKIERKELGQKINY